MLKYLDNCVYVKGVGGVRSPTFMDQKGMGKKSDDILAIYNAEERPDMDKNATESDIVEFLSNAVNHSPDGWLLFIPEQYEVKELIEREYLKAYEADELNFTNGDLAESIIFHQLDSGLLVELYDPECGTDFFYRLVDEISKVATEGFLAQELCHMPSHVEELDQEFLAILERNNIPYDKAQD